VDFDQVLKEVLWRLVTEGSISYRRIFLMTRPSRLATVSTCRRWVS
jgi:hypothetical protein